MVETQAEWRTGELDSGLPPVWPELWAHHTCLMCHIGRHTKAMVLNLSGKVSWAYLLVDDTYGN